MFHWRNQLQVKMIDYQQCMLLNTNNETRDGKKSLPEIDLLGKI